VATVHGKIFNPYYFHDVNKVIGKGIDEMLDKVAELEQETCCSLLFFQKKGITLILH
jgi:hypothetical protein